MLGRLVRSTLERLGYVLWKREFIRYGVDPFLDVTRLSRGWERSIDTVFDVGANIGQTTRAALDAFPQARIFAFEPEPKTFEQMSRSVGGDRVSLHQLALADKNGVAAFYEYGIDGDGGSLRNSLVPNARSTVEFGYSSVERSVPCRTIDDFCRTEGVERIDLLKIDVEGFELSVLHGAERMLREGRIGFVYAEFNDLQPKAGAAGGALLPLAEYLHGFGLRYVATYTDFVLPEGGVFVVANVLFAAPPSASAPAA